mgnify:CR=1 FL=1
MIKELKVKKFRPKHLKGLELRPQDINRNIKNARKWIRHGVAYSFFDDEQIVFCGGVVFLSDGIGEAWIICDANIRKYVRWLYKYSKEYLNRIRKDFKLHRIQCTVRSGWDEAEIFVQNLNFKKEGFLQKYIGKQNHYLYARVW